MTHAYSLTDGATTVSLSSSGVFLTQYTPVAPSINGAPNYDYEIVTETLELTPHASSTSTLQAIINGIDRLLDEARLRQKSNSEPRVYLQLQVDGESDTYRSEVLYGRLELQENAMAVWGNYQVPARLHITRRPFWEGPRTELSISTSGNSAGTGGKPITNTAANWIQIANTQVDGVLPTPIELQLTNNGGAGVGYRNFYMGTNATSGTTLTHSYSGASASLSLVSGIYTGQITVALSAAQMALTKGKPFKIFARFTTQTASVYCKPILRDVNNLMPLVEGDEVYMPLASAGTRWVDFGTLPLPPGGYSTVWTDANLNFYFRSATAASLTINVVRLMAMDSYQYIVQRGFTVAAGGVMTFDNIEGLYHQAGQSIYSVRTEEPLMIFPNVTQRVNIMFDEGSSSDTAKTLSVQAYYRKRRLTI